MEFTIRLMTWYEENKRELPFRGTLDPYHVWVSEIMAQQTQITTMLPYYNAWIKKYPTISHLAQADIQDVLKSWEGLGYYNRARNLHKGAQFVMEHFGGSLPANKEKLMMIPGVGDYTSSAIAAIAFNLPEIAVDGNVKRVMARFLNYTENVNTRKAHQYFENYLKEKLRIGGANPSDFVQALMELGSLVYTPANVTCQGSPFKELCACYRGENVGTIPYIPKAKKAPSFNKTVMLHEESNHIMLSKDDQDGLMKGLYRLPQIDGHLVEEPHFTLVHKFSHLHWNIHAHIMQVNQDHDLWFLFPIDRLKDVSIVTAHKKILDSYLKQRIKES